MLYITLYSTQAIDIYVTQVHKKRSVNDVNNYRGITLLSALFTKVLDNRLCEWAESYNIYIAAQAGFRSKLGITDNVFVSHGILNHVLNKGKQLFCAFINFSKAFDYVNRDNLWSKLIQLGLRGNILNIVRSIYEKVKSKVKDLNQLSNSFDCTLCVRQRECLSLFLFSMFLNGIEDMYVTSGLDGIEADMFKIFITLYTDDIVIFANSADELQTSLN